jgi:hypothetical protein
MEDNTVEVNRELREINRERKLYQFELNKEQTKIAQALRSEMGEDMKKVLQGEREVVLPLSVKIKYKVKNFINKIFNTF